MRSSTRSRFQLLSESSVKISLISDKPNSEKERRVGHLRDAVHDDFERDGDLLLDLLGRDARPLRDDLDVIVGHVRIGVDGQMVERHVADAGQQNRKSQNEQALVERKIDDAGGSLLGSHCCSRVCCRTRALATTRSPGATPERISCILPGQHVAGGPPRCGGSGRRPTGM